ncbi:MAG: threonylcarbamoyl-AMP synthase [Flavobacteriales bacterium]|nr:threonylcarbamoyl-AMP synthase [Flavobacteriales bacterium]
MLLEIHPDNPDEKKIRKVVDLLNEGAVIIYPTDGVYAIGCSLLKSKAIDRVAKIKGLKTEKANFSIVCHDLSHLSEYARVDTPIYKIMKKALPGPYTFILEASNKIPKFFNNNKRSVGIRVPNNAIVRMIVKELGHPIISTSVHDDDEVIEYTTDPELIHEKYDKAVDLVIAGGYGKNEASTIIDCTDGYPEVIREGIGPTEDLF